MCYVHLEPSEIPKYGKELTAQGMDPYSKRSQRGRGAGDAEPDQNARHRVPVYGRLYRWIPYPRFFVATPIFIFSLLLYLKGGSWKRCLATALIFTVVCYIGFVVIMGVAGLSDSGLAFGGFFPAGRFNAG